MPNYMNLQDEKLVNVITKNMHVIFYFKKKIGIKSNFFIKNQSVQNQVKTHQCASSVGG